MRGLVAVVLSFTTAGAGLQAQGPAGGVVRAGDAHITGEGTASTRIEQFSDRAIIDWRSFGIGAGDQVVFVQPSSQAATLNRVTGDQVSVLLGKLDAAGQVLLINPNGIVFGAGAQVNVGSLIASTSNVTNANFMASRLVFDAPGRPGAGILNAGTVTAKDSGLVALVAPHVRNDGVIVARLGKVVLGAADTFTVDLYGDALVNLALSDASAGQLRTLDGEPVGSLVANRGQIDTPGGQAILITARGARSVLDNLINMSGTIRADSAVQQGGRILLLGEGGTVDVGGTLSASGRSGGSIEVLGDRVHVSAGASLDASGLENGGIVHAGGAYQGSGDTYRSTRTTIDAGATLAANAGARGNGGEVVVWSDGQTAFAGAVQARGGAAGGDGGRLEVSGKQTLAFDGQADASAAAGHSGSLLLDPASLDIGAAEAGAIARVLRTGTSTTLAADADIDVNAGIYAGDRTAGGGLTLTAGRDINVNDFIVTHDGAVTLSAAAGMVNVAADKAVFAGSAPITVNASGTIHTAPLVTGGALSIRSTAGSVIVDSFLDGHTGPISLRAAGSVDIDQPIVNFVAGDGLTVVAGADVNVNAQVDGRGGVEGGAVTMTAGQSVNVNRAVITNNGGISLTATTGALTIAPDAPIVAGTGAIALTARDSVAIGPSSGGALTVVSSGGSVVVNGLIDPATGDTWIAAASDVTINQPIANGQGGKALTVDAGRDVNLNALVDGRGGVSGGTVALTAGRNLNVNEWILTNNGAIDLTATGGAALVGSGKGVGAGTGAVAIRAAGDLTTGAVSGGALSAASTTASVRVTGAFEGNSFNATAGRDVIVDAQVDTRSGATGGAVSLKAARDVVVNRAVATNNGTIAIAAADGSATMAPGTVLSAGTAPISVMAAGDVVSRNLSGGSVSLSSGAGSVNVNGVIDGATGRVDLTAARDVNINAAVLNTRSGALLNATAGQDINVNARIDGSSGVSGGAVNLAARGDVTVAADITTRDGAILVSAANGTARVVSSAGLFSGDAAISVDGFGDVTTGTLSGGAMTVTSRSGDVEVSGPISSAGGAISIAAAGAVDIAHAITNPASTSALAVTAGTSINVAAPIDGRIGAVTSSGAVALTAGHDVALNDSITTRDASISVTAQTGTVTTAAGEGLFAGSGGITVQSGQTLSSGITSTTGPLALRSTGGAVEIDAAISGDTGAVTIVAATDVTVNQGIANPRGDAPLTITAGHDITVNAALDGRDDLLPRPSGATTLAAGHDIVVHDNIVTRDGALSLTADSGAITVTPGSGLFAGSGAIALTSDATLTTPTLSTTGALTLRSTGGAVNIDTPLDDTTGAVTIDAATAVNVNQSITSLKTGHDLSITAGTDINVLAAIDGRGGASPGGAVTMTAGGNIALTTFVATHDGAVSLTATAGTLTVPIGVENMVTPMQWIVSAGNAPISLTTGGDFALSSPVVTTGSLAITSTHGDVTIAAPITDQTGAVAIVAGDALVVNHQIKSNDQPITLTAGPGGITVNVITDFDQTKESAVNSGNANLTLNSVGDVTILDPRGISSAQAVTIDTRGQIVTGSIGDSETSPGSVRPQSVNLNADGGIASFDTGHVGDLVATSSGGSITLIVDAPGRLRVTTGTPGTTDCPTCDIAVMSTSFDTSIGPDVVLNAGGSVVMSNFRSDTVSFTARSGDITLEQALIDGSFTAAAGRDLVFTAITWLEQGMSGSAGRDIVTSASSPIHVSNGNTLALTAGRNLTTFLLETLGAVNLTASTGNITLNNDIGPHILNSTTQADFNPADLGVASLMIAAPAATATVTMQGARAEGDVTITTGGSLTAAKQITSVHGQVTIATGGAQSLSSTPIGTQLQLTLPGFVSPVAPPGPRANLPTPPGVASQGGPGLPAFAEIAVAASDQNDLSVITPAAAGGSLVLPGAPGGAAASGRAGGFASTPTTPNGPGIGTVSGSSDPGTADTASALRAAGASCGEEDSAQADTGLNALAPGAAADVSDQQSASCPPARQTGEAVPAQAAPPTGGGVQ